MYTFCTTGKLKHLNTNDCDLGSLEHNKYIKSINKQHIYVFYILMLILEGQIENIFTTVLYIANQIQYQLGLKI